MQSLPIVLEYLSQKDRTPSSQPEHADLPLHRVVRQRTHNLPPEQGKRRLKLKPDANGNKPQWDIYSIQKQQTLLYWRALSRRFCFLGWMCT